MAPLLKIIDYRAYFRTRRGVVRAVDHLSYEIHAGETLGIVGESGSGKSVSQLSYLGLLPKPPLEIVGGEVFFQGQDILKFNQNQLRQIRGSEIAMIFQDPMSSLNPYLKIGTQLIEPIQVHLGKTKKQAWSQGIGALERVGISDAEEAMNSYPHEFSGGMRQRVMIAMALTTKPKLLIADEPTTALDVTVQAQILDLLKDIQKETNMAIILITHDLGVVANISDRIVVMYAGKIFEQGTAESIFYQPAHPYTKALLKSTPRIDQAESRLSVIQGNPPDLSRLGSGCPFYDRCDYRISDCEIAFPNARKPEPNHQSFCHVEVK